MIDCTISNGWVKLLNANNRELNAINDFLAFQVPGHEHMPLFKQGKWDGIKHYFDWRTKSFQQGLFGYVQRKAGVELNVTCSDLAYIKMDYSPITIKHDGQEFPMRDFQESAVKKLLAVHSGMVQLATNAGKTACMASIVSSAFMKQKNVVILEGRIDLVYQVKKEIEDCTGLCLGIFTAKEKKFSDIMVVMVQSVATSLKRIQLDNANENDIEVCSRLKNTHIYLIDETHHGAAPSYVDILSLNPKAMRYGFSGTIPSEDDIYGIELMELFGDVVIKVSNQELIDREISAKPTINMIEYGVDGLEEKVAVFKAQIKNTCMKPIYEGTDDKGKKIIKFGFSVPMFTAKVKEMVMNYSIRHSMDFWNIVKDLAQVKHPNDSTMILVDWIEFGEDLAKHLGTEILHGKRNYQDRRRIIQEFMDGKIKHLVATSILDEGISIDRIKVLILATAGKSTRQFLQRIGRGLRKKVDDNRLIVYDFVRYGHEYLLNPSKERIAIWKNEGFEVVFND